MKLKEPVMIGNLNLRNRIVMPPMAMGKARDGKPGDDLVEYYRARARGTALIIVEHEYIMPQGMAHKGQLSMSDDSVIPAFKTLTDAVHGEGAKIIAQLNHAGAKASDTGMTTLGPSAVAFQEGTVPEELTHDQIKEIIQAFADASVRAKKAGFDGVEVHAAHGYLLNQFYSPLMNKREDEYSVKTMENRTRLHKEVVHAVRKAVGDDFTVAIRFGACDFLEGGSAIEDIPEAVKYLEQTGVDLIDVTAGMMGFLRPGHTEPGYLKDLGLAAKSVAGLPIILTGGVQTAQDAEKLLADEACDLVGVGRAILKDADWAVKALEV